MRRIWLVLAACLALVLASGAAATAATAAPAARVPAVTRRRGSGGGRTASR